MLLNSKQDFKTLICNVIVFPFSFTTKVLCGVSFIIHRFEASWIVAWSSTTHIYVALKGWKFIACSKYNWQLSKWVIPFVPSKIVWWWHTQQQKAKENTPSHVKSSLSQKYSDETFHLCMFTKMKHVFYNSPASIYYNKKRNCIKYCSIPNSKIWYRNEKIIRFSPTISKLNTYSMKQVCIIWNIAYVINCQLLNNKIWKNYESLKLQTLCKK